MTRARTALAGRLVVGLAGVSLDPAERAWLLRWRPAGVILFARNVQDNNQLQRLCGELHAAVPGLEIVADHEGGPVSVLAAAVGRPPAAATLGLLDDPDLTRRVHAESARAAAACGVDRLLAPVADVAVNLLNPVIGVRAFAADARVVARHVAAAVTGLREGGVRCCVKHWPGHGGTAGDSHQGAARDPGRPPAAPFVAGLEAGADAVMVAHLTTAGRPDLPATLVAGEDVELGRLAAGRRLQLWADDLTMAALRRPLADRGVAVPAGEGMLDPDDLPLPWIAAVAAGGCDRLLVRGIPWRAFGTDRGPGPAPPPVTGIPAGDGAARSEARARLGALLPAGLAAATAVAWIDRTGDDRWGPVAGTEGGRELGAALGRRTGALLAEDGVAGADGLIVTSHRPLDRRRELAWVQAAAAQGVALGVGHPALAADLRALLPAGWRVAWLPEWPGWTGSRADQKI